jgi:enamine deaminase RidA (YjgF/YER057c/UK114 family)
LPLVCANVLRLKAACSLLDPRRAPSRLRRPTSTATLRSDRGHRCLAILTQKCDCEESISSVAPGKCSTSGCRGLRRRARCGRIAAVTGPEARLKELGIELPGLQPAVGNYLSAKRVDNLVFVSGHGPARVDAGGLIAGKNLRDLSIQEALAAAITGKVDSDISVEQAREAARFTGLFLLSALRAEVGSLDRVRSVLKVFGMVNCAPGFTNTPAVIDGCSDFLVEVFGEEVGRHARSAVGMAELPMNISVEIEMVVVVESD